jgi:hypothetical protein
MDFLTYNSAGLIDLVISLVGAFAIIATMTPNKVDNKIADALLRVVNFLGANFGKAKNE